MSQQEEGQQQGQSPQQGQQQQQLYLSAKLLRLIDDITENTLKIRNLFKQLDEQAIKEGFFNTDEIDLLIHEKYKELLNKSITAAAAAGVVTNNNNDNITTIDNNNNTNSSSYPYSQYFK